MSGITKEDLAEELICISDDIFTLYLMVKREDYNKASSRLVEIKQKMFDLNKCLSISQLETGENLKKVNEILPKLKEGSLCFSVGDIFEMCCNIDEEVDNYATELA